MRRVIRVAITAATVLWAIPAQAQGWRWLERLSGPGDFTGFELNVKLLCRYDPIDTGAEPADPGSSAACVVRQRGGGNDVTVASPGNSGSRRANSSPRDDTTPGSVAEARGGRVDLAKRQYALGVAISYLRGKNDLPYEPTPTHVDREIQVWAFEGFFDHRLTSRLDAGIAVGPNLFVVPAHENFTNWSVEPRVTLKLFDLRRGRFYSGTASVRFGLLAFFQEFDATDFGAIAGSYRSGTEVGPSVRFIFDFDRNPLSSN